MKNNVKLNFLYNIIYQALILIVPLITAPYLSRIIYSEGIGIYSYTYSIVHYFMLLTLLGVNNYGNRSIAKVRDNKEKLSKTFFSIYSLQLIMGLIMIILYLIYFLFVTEYKLIAFIQLIFIVSAMLDINWFFFGLEEFRKTITRNATVKILSAFLIFVLVKSKNDVWIYTLILSGTTCFSQIVLWGFLKKYISFTKVKWIDIKKHIKPNLTLFVPVVAISLYKIMDKIMLGVLSSVSEVGLYENAEKIVNIPLTLITALGTVMLPRMANLTSKGDIKKIEYYIDKSERFVMFMSMPMCFGLIGIGQKFAPMFFGNDFEKTGFLIILLALTLPVLGFANVLRTQYLIPKEKDIIYIKSVFLAAFVNLIMNLMFIPKYGSIGACFGTIAAEFTVMFYQAISIRNDLPIKTYIVKSVPFLIKAIIMLTFIYPFNLLSINEHLRLALQLCLGCFIYGILNIKYIMVNINFKQIKYCLGGMKK